MELAHALQKVAILGAAGKMGRGISLVLLQEMAQRQGPHELVLIDQSEAALETLTGCFQPQLEKYAERHQLGADYAAHALSLVKTSSNLFDAKHCHLIFEAIVEDIEVKTKIFRELAKNSNHRPYFLSNTSSIPIKALEDAAGLNGHLIGFHFYNPPPVQKLVELIPSPTTAPALIKLSEDLGRALKKTLVQSHDIAGFIGNGHFVREILYACQQVQKLTNGHCEAESVFLINKVTQDLLIRPMGIFQLLDYVGLDVAQKICAVMARFIPGGQFSDALLEKMVRMGVIGGQYPDGSQKSGFFQYEKGRPVAVYDARQQSYVSLREAPWLSAAEKQLGSMPHGHGTWKDLLKDPERSEKLKAYFSALFAAKDGGTAIARDFLLHSKSIAQGLVKQGVAARVEDVNTVLENGFFHLYGPVNSYY